MCACVYVYEEDKVSAATKIIVSLLSPNKEADLVPISVDWDRCCLVVDLYRLNGPLESCVSK